MKQIGSSPELAGIHPHRPALNTGVSKEGGTRAPCLEIRATSAVALLGCLPMSLLTRIPLRKMACGSNVIRKHARPCDLAEMPLTSVDT